MTDIDKITPNLMRQSAEGNRSVMANALEHGADRLESLTQEVERLREALVKHGTHEDYCLAGLPLPEGGCVQCSCGLHAALATDPEGEQP